MRQLEMAIFLFVKKHGKLQILTNTFLHLIVKIVYNSYLPDFKKKKPSQIFGSSEIVFSSFHV